MKIKSYKYFISESKDEKMKIDDLKEIVNDVLIELLDIGYIVYVKEEEDIHKYKYFKITIKSMKVSKGVMLDKTEDHINRLIDYIKYSYEKSDNDFEYMYGLYTNTGFDAGYKFYTNDVNKTPLFKEIRLDILAKSDEIKIYIKR